jgi:carnitine-CoA ligase
MHLGIFLLKGIRNFAAVQMEYGTLWETLRESRKAKTLKIASKAYLGELLERQAGKFSNNKFLYYQDDKFTYSDMNTNANRVAHALMDLDAKPKDGVSIMTTNSPAYYDLFFAAQKMGMYAVPTNTSLRGAGLTHILNNSEVKYMVVHPTLIEYVESIKDDLTTLKTIIIDDIEDDAPDNMPDDYKLLSSFYDETIPITRPPHNATAGDLAVLMYTSGTTGLPKGVVYRHGDSSMTMLQVLGRTNGTQDDILYTCLPLYHANALFVTSLSALAVGAAVGLDKKFSASRFWDRVRFYRATTFNLLGAMIPILMKQPEKPNDREHNVDKIITSACPPDLWAKFEDRFGVEIWEAYGAVDGGGALIMNIGNAPKGSIGKPLGAKVKLVDDEGNEVPVGERGELLVATKKSDTKSDGSVEYFRNDEATDKKTKGGWIRTGDYMKADEAGNLYFVGRDSESMRRRGENVSTYEVEVEIHRHPAILDVAVYGVPSELGEEDIMASAILVEGEKVEVSELMEFLKDKLAYFAIPRYWNFVDELPKTGTHRVIKSKLQEIGVTEDTFDAEKEGVMIKKST